MEHHSSRIVLSLFKIIRNILFKNLTRKIFQQKISFVHRGKGDNKINNKFRLLAMQFKYYLCYIFFKYTLNNFTTFLIFLKFLSFIFDVLNFFFSLRELFLNDH